MKQLVTCANVLIYRERTERHRQHTTNTVYSTWVLRYQRFSELEEGDLLLEESKAIFSNFEIKTS